MTKLIGMYSQAAVDAGSHTSFYTNEAGDLIECTNVDETMDGYHWDDKIDLGPVTKFVRRGRSNTSGFQRG